MLFGMTLACTELYSRGRKLFYHIHKRLSNDLLVATCKLTGYSEAKVRTYAKGQIYC